MQFHPSIHIGCYSPFQALASPMRRLHSSLFAALLLHPLQLLFIAAQLSIYQSHPRHLWGFLNIDFFPEWGCQPHTQPPTWRTRVSLFVWGITFVQSGLGGPASSYTTAGLALWIIWPHKPHHYIKVETPSGGILQLVNINTTLPNF
jgi:hypothetical protein